MKPLLARLWERHKNPASWVLRPVFGAVLFYGAWAHSVLLILVGIIGLSTSWCWFPKPRVVHPMVERFINVERHYLTPPWTPGKVIALVLVFLFLIAVMCVLWNRSTVLGLWVLLLGSLVKSVWSLVVAGRAGIPAAWIGVVSAAICGGILIAL